MHNLVEFLAKFNHWLVFIILEALGFTLLFHYNSYQGSVWFSSANTVTGVFFEWSAKVEQFFGMVKMNETLTRRNIYLEHKAAKLEETLRDRTDATEQLYTAQKQLPERFRFIPAKVISNSIHLKDNLMTLNKGETDGVRKDMGVVCGTGVVGIIYQVSTHYSIVLPILNSQSNISCSIEKRGYFGQLRWDGGSSRIAYVEEIPRHARFRLYDRVVTSGYSSIFPPGIMIGKILHVYNSKDGISYSLMVELSTDFSNLRDVCIIDDSMMKERIELMRNAQDLMKPKDNF